MAAIPSTEYDQELKFRDQLFWFIICKFFKNSPDAVLDNLQEFAQAHGVGHLPNIIISLNDGFVQNVSINTMSLQSSSLTADAFAFVPEKPRAFTFLVTELERHAREGRSVPLYAFDRYMTSSAGALPQSLFRPYT
jgi:hypothetical protein